MQQKTFFSIPKASKKKPHRIEAINTYEVKSYILMNEATPHGNLDVDSIFDGMRNQSYIEKNNQALSINFKLDCKQFKDLERAIDEAKYAGGESSKSIYIMKMGYDVEKVKLLTLQGIFNRTIVSAVNAKDLIKAINGLKSFSEVEEITNINFDNNLNRIILGA